jgi:hypothetical protein
METGVSLRRTPQGADGPVYACEQRELQILAYRWSRL